MRPCIGIPHACPPLCTWKELHDGTYTITDVLRFHIAMDEILDEIDNG